MAILKYKNAEGNFVPLNNYVVLPITVSLTTGNSTTVTMSQDAITRGLNGKVDKVSGKGLSTNDYTTTEKNKLAGIATGANNYSLPKATNTVLGGVKTGSNITNTDGTISLTKANVTNALGVDPTTAYVKKAGDTMTGLLKSTVATGTAPISVNSTTECTNLNAERLNGLRGPQYAILGNIRGSILYTDNDTHILKLMDIKLDLTYASYLISIQACFYGLLHFSTAIMSIHCNTFQSLRIAISILSEEHKMLLMRRYYYKIVDNIASIYVEVLGGNAYGTWNVNPLSICDSSGNSRGKTLSVSIVGNQPKEGLIPIEQSATGLTNQKDDWYGVSWSETSSNPDCTRIGNMDMHRTLPILSMMKPFMICGKYTNFQEIILPIDDNFSKILYSSSDNNLWNTNTNIDNIMIRIPEFWYIDDYIASSKTHNLKICPHAKPGWNHHKEAYVGAYEGFNDTGTYLSVKGKIPTVNVTRETIRTAARANGAEGEHQYNIYTYEEHRAICHLFLVEYATRNSLKAVNTSLTAEGFRQGGLGTGCTTGTATINGLTVYSFIPTGSSDSLGNGSGEVTVTIQQTDASGNNTTTITKKCNRYRGIENPFGHIWKHCDDVISKYNTDRGIRIWYKSMKPDQFATNMNNTYKPLCGNAVVTGYKTEIKATMTCDFFAAACSSGSESTYWCDYNWDNTDTSEHCLLIGGSSASGGSAGLFALSSTHGVGSSAASLGSRLTYLLWAE